MSTDQERLAMNMARLAHLEDRLDLIEERLALLWIIVSSRGDR